MMLLEWHNYNADKVKRMREQWQAHCWRGSRDENCTARGTVHVQLDLKGIHQAPFFARVEGLSWHCRSEAEAEPVKKRHCVRAASGLQRCMKWSGGPDLSGVEGFIPRVGVADRITSSGYGWLVGWPDYQTTD